MSACEDQFEVTPQVNPLLKMNKRPVENGNERQPLRSHGGGIPRAYENQLGVFEMNSDEIGMLLQQKPDADFRRALFDCTDNATGSQILQPQQNPGEFLMER